MSFIGFAIGAATVYTCVKMKELYDDISDVRQENEKLKQRLNDLEEDLEDLEDDDDDDILDEFESRYEE